MQKSGLQIIRKNSQQNKPEHLCLIQEAIPIKKKQLNPPRSLFNLTPLPNFTYSKQQSRLSYQSTPSSQKQAFILPSTQFCELFKLPIYKSNQYYNLAVTNQNFATLGVSPKKSGIHQTLKIKKPLKFTFESRFECGNLGLVAKSQLKDHYYLILQRDTNTRKCTQWFFFKVFNCQFVGTVTFHLLNFTKSYSVFENGMKISVAQSSNNYQWQRGCQNIRYRKTNIEYGSRNYYCLSFSFNFQHPNDEVYFAYSYPYTYSQLDKFLWETQNSNSSVVKRRTLTESLGGNNIDFLTITNSNSNKNKNRKKKIVYIVGRVHPGETPSSFVMEGLINFLTNPQSDNLRDYFVFKIIPMLNPDGVINGNYRCGISGHDLNRIWDQPDRDNHPQIYYTKKIIQQSQCFLFIDLHAHSKKRGVFMYGCTDAKNPFISRHIPYLLSQEISSFNFYQCNFNNNAERQGTARLTVWRDLGIKYSYTMEHSFCGPIQDKTHFLAHHYRYIGQKICFTLFKYFCRKDKTFEEILTQFQETPDIVSITNQQQSFSSDQQITITAPLAISTSRQKIKHINKIKIKQENSQFIKFRQTQIQTLIEPRIYVPRKTFTPFSPEKQNTSENQKYLYIQKSPKNILPTLEQISITSHQKISGFKGISFTVSPQKVNRNIINYQNNSYNKNSQRYDYNQVNELSNLFLPSVTKISYKSCKKYSKNNLAKNVNRDLPFTLKQQIKSVQRKKPNWKQYVQSFL